MILYTTPNKNLQDNEVWSLKNDIIVVISVKWTPLYNWTLRSDSSVSILERFDCICYYHHDFRCVASLHPPIEQLLSEIKVGNSLTNCSYLFFLFKAPTTEPSPTEPGKKHFTYNPHLIVDCFHSPIGAYMVVCSSKLLFVPKSVKFWGQNLSPSPEAKQI